MRRQTCVVGGLILWAAGGLLYMCGVRSNSPVPVIDVGAEGRAGGPDLDAEGLAGCSDLGAEGRTGDPDPGTDGRADGLRHLFDAIAFVESNGDDSAVGDGGKSIGRYQIGRLYWMDSRVPGKYEDVLDPAYAERVMLAYWSRWCPEALANRDCQTLARVHNGGPRGASKSATLPYWRRVEGRLKETKP